MRLKAFCKKAASKAYAVSEFLTFKKRESRKFGDNSDRKTIRTRNGYLV
ncbi:hypothetical protein [Paenibacillus xylanexedens]|nr:hypothetical protein [Paenibacillus xylanexedens]